jgi:hypothetical protein
MRSLQPTGYLLAEYADWMKGLITIMPDGRLGPGQGNNVLA